MTGTKPVPIVEDLASEEDDGIRWISEVGETNREVTLPSLLCHAGIRLELSNYLRWHIPVAHLMDIFQYSSETLLSLSKDELFMPKACRRFWVDWDEKFPLGGMGHGGIENCVKEMYHVSLNHQYAMAMRGHMSVETPRHQELSIKLDNGRMELELNSRCPSRRISMMNADDAGLYNRAGEMIYDWIARKDYFSIMRLYLRHPDYYHRWERRK